MFREKKMEFTKFIVKPENLFMLGTTIREFVTGNGVSMMSTDCWKKK